MQSEVETVERRSNEVLKDIAQSWGLAQSQLGELRKQIEEATALAQAKVEAAFLSHQLDHAYRDLGEAVWKKVQAGELQLSRSFSTVVKALREVERRTQDNNAGIHALLDEGRDVADRSKKRR